MKYASYVSENLPQPEAFYNRENELKALERAWALRRAGGVMGALYGRRRLGKTYLLQRFFAGVKSTYRVDAKPHCYFLADQTTHVAHRLALASEILSALPTSGVTPADLAVSWHALFRYVSTTCKEGGRFGLILDEFPYLVEQTKELPSIIQAWWDREGIHSRVFLVLCGSQISMMEALGQENEPLYGRFDTGLMQLHPLRYDQVAEFYKESDHFGVKEKLVLYGALGGTPRYHSLVNPSAIMDQASGMTNFGRIMNFTGIERGAASFYLKTLTELGWIRREFPFGESSEKRGIYQVDDPFVAFWYRFVAPLSSLLQFGDVERIYQTRVKPYLSDYMGLSVFESVCRQWLERYAHDLTDRMIKKVGRYWSRDGQTEVDIMAELEDGSYLFGECKWSADSQVGLNVLVSLRAKVESLPEARWKMDAWFVRWKRDAWFVLFSVGGFAPELVAFASNSKNRLYLVSGNDLLSGPPG